MSRVAALVQASPAVDAPLDELLEVVRRDDDRGGSLDPIRVHRHVTEPDRAQLNCAPNLEHVCSGSRDVLAESEHLDVEPGQRLEPREEKLLIHLAHSPRIDARVSPPSRVIFLAR